MTYQINLTAAEDAALSYVAFSQDDWIQNAVHERCRVAIEEIVAAEIQRKLTTGEPIAGSKEELVMAAPVLSAAERQADLDAKLAVSTGD